MRKLEIAREVQRVVNEAIIYAPVLPDLRGYGICCVVATHCSSRFGAFEDPYNHTRELDVNKQSVTGYAGTPGEWDNERLMLAAMLAVIPPEDYV